MGPGCNRQAGVRIVSSALIPGFSGGPSWGKYKNLSYPSVYLALRLFGLIYFFSTFNLFIPGTCTAVSVDLCSYECSSSPIFYLTPEESHKYGLCLEEAR